MLGVFQRGSGLAFHALGGKGRARELGVFDECSNFAGHVIYLPAHAAIANGSSRSASAMIFCARLVKETRWPTMGSLFGPKRDRLVGCVAATAEVDVALP